MLRVPRPSGFVPSGCGHSIASRTIPFWYCVVGGEHRVAVVIPWSAGAHSPQPNDEVKAERNGRRYTMSIVVTRELFVRSKTDSYMTSGNSEESDIGRHQQ